MAYSKRKAIREQVLATSRILIVDDSDTTRLIIRSFCKQAGFVHIAEAVDGVDALNYLHQHPVDLVFLDIQMPRMDGLTVCRELATAKMLDNLIIIMQTASDKSELKAQAFEVGVTDLISKPLDSRETIARVVAHLERRFLQKKSDDEHHRIQAELNEAVILQNILLPKEEMTELIKRELDIDIAHYYHPASELAGDYISVRRLSDNRIALISVDISGHGVTSALYAFSVHTLLDDALLETQTPSEALSALNSKLHAFMSAGKFATALIMIIDSKTKTIDYASAAAPAPLFLSNGKPETLETRGHLLGVDEVVHFDTRRFSYEKGDLLLIYSDALIESPDKQGVSMQMGDIVQVMQDKRALNANSHLKNMIIAFYDKFTRHPVDDLSMILCKL